MSAIHACQDEEPLGRWENRCGACRSQAHADFTEWADVCDRPRGHKGLHRGRRFNFRTRTVSAYIAWTS